MKRKGLNELKLKKDGTPRKVGSGMFNPKPENPLKGTYKIYVLMDPDTLDYFYVGLTKQWLCKRLEYHIYSAKTARTTTLKDEYILNILKEDKKPRIEMLELLKTEDLKEAKMIENEYIKMYGITNKCMNRFKGTYQNIGKANKNRALILEAIRSGMSQYEAGKLYVENQVNYLYKRFGMNKKSMFIKMFNEYQAGTSLMDIKEKYNASNYILYKILKNNN